MVTNTFVDSDLPPRTPTFSLASAPDGMVIDPVTGVLVWTPAEAQGPSTNLVTVQVTDNGSPPLSDSRSFIVVVNEVNRAPVLTVPPNKVVHGLATLVVTNIVTDPDVPPNTQTFSLLSAPDGVSLDPSSGVLTWTPTEAQRSTTTNLIIVRVTDNGSPPLSDTGSITVVFKEENSPPVLTVPANQTINELSTFVVTNRAIDPDIPVNSLTFSLVSAPAGMTVDFNTGVLRWTPTETQGPSTNLITVQVTDNGSPPLSVSNSFTVVVNEVNSAPVLTVPANQTINELTMLVLTNTATDADLPANTLSFSLLSAPAGMTLDPNTGVLTWTPTETQGPGTNLITVQVTDNGSPPLSASRSFTVVVSEANTAPELTVPANQTINEQTFLVLTSTATDADSPANTLTFSLVSAPAGMTLDSNTGVLTWTPAETQGPSTNLVIVRVTDNGSPPLSDSRSFTVVVNEVNSAPVLTVPPNKAIHGLATLVVTNTATDPDVPADTLTFELVSAPGGVSLDPSSGVLTWTPIEAQRSSTNLITIRVTDNGSPPLSDTGSFTVVVNEENGAPVLTVPANQTINELSTFVVTNRAIDPDIPVQGLAFSLVSAPAGVTLDSNTGVLAWTPTEAQGPSTNLITVRVTDNGSPPLSTTNSFTVVVQEVNSAPVLTVPANQTITELSTLTVTNAATDPDLPVNALNFKLLSAPAGMTLNSATGVLTWTPTETQGPSTNLITVRVTDNGSPPLSATNSFTVVVFELNSAPVLTVPLNQTMNELSTLVVTNTATDPDIPANTLTFSLVSAPAGVNLDANTGVLMWTPTEAQGPSTNLIALQVTDNGSPPLSASGSFTVIVNEVNSAPVLIVPPNQTIDELTTLVLTNTATDSDIPANTLTFDLLSAPPGVSLDSKTGVLTWTPTEAQGPSTNLITVKVTDNGVPALSRTNSFSVVVNEVNKPPVLLEMISELRIDELTLLVLDNPASDPDLPANTLTWSLVSAPEGMTINSAVGFVRWTPTEAQGPSTNLVTIKVTDDGSPPLSAIENLTIIVDEVNSAPVLTVPRNQTINELSTLVLTNSATDPDIPANTLTFSLVAAPEGVILDASTGVLTWTPTETQGPSTNLITVKVTDNGSPPLNDSNSFTVVVNEVNRAPVLTVPPDQTINELSTLVLTNTATDPDIPVNTLTFSLVSAPAGISDRQWRARPERDQQLHRHRQRSEQCAGANGAAEQSDPWTGHASSHQFRHGSGRAGQHVDVQSAVGAGRSQP